MPTGDTQAIAISNPFYHPNHLEGGQFLGHFHTAGLVMDNSIEGERVYHISTEQPLYEDRQHQLMHLLQREKRGLDKPEMKQLETLMEEFSDVFAVKPEEHGSTEPTTQVINTKDHLPVKQYPRHMPFALRSKVEEMINQMLQQNVIKPSKCPWASPIVLVSKKDGSTRFCVDYRKLNARTKKDVYPLPRIDDTLDLLATNEFFSTLDLASGYWQIKMDEASKEKTAFTTHVGLFEFEVMPFGLCNAPATFQRLMENILHGIIGKACLVCTLMISYCCGGLWRTVEEHLQNLVAVWERLREAGLRLKPSKCKLLQRELEYLGFCVSAAGVATSPQKVTALISSSVLASPDFSQEFILETDASKKGLGAVFPNPNHPGESGL